MSNALGRNLLEQIVASYTGALVQREHLKNKRLDDIITTAGNYTQQNLQTSIERVAQKLGASLEVNDASVGPSVEYGEMPRQLGVTPYPAPPVTVNVSDESHSFQDSNVQNGKEPSNSNPVPPPPPAAASQIKRDDVSFQETPNSSRPVEAKKTGFPWKETLAGTALAASVATNGYLMYKAGANAAPPSPAGNTDIYMDSGMGSVSIGVE